MKRPSWCPCLSDTECDWLCLECLKARTENFIEWTTMKTEIKLAIRQDIAETLASLVEDGMP